MFAFCSRLNGLEHKDHTMLVIASASEAMLKATLAFSARHAKDCHGPEFTLSAAEGGLAITFLGAFLQRVSARPEKNVGTMNLLAIKSYRFCLNYVLLLSNS